MRGPVILFGSTQQNRQQHVCDIVSKELDQKINWNYLENFPDIKIVAPLEEKKSIGIAQIREAIGFLSEKPLALDLKILIVNKANLLTDEAQNAFLKSLEETPSYVLIVFLAKTEGNFLPTVLSRCKKIKTFAQIGNSSLEQPNKSWKLDNVLVLTKGELLDWAEETAKEEKDTIIEILEAWIEEGRNMLLNGDLDKKRLSENLELIAKILDDLENTNVTTRLALEFLVINL